MNIYLIPHTWARHIAPALSLSGAALAVWWLLLNVEVWLGPKLFSLGFLWRQGVEGGLLLVLTATVIAFMSIMVEGSLRRRDLLRRLGMAILAGLLTFILAIIFYAAAYGIVQLLAAETMKPIVADASMVSLKHRGILWGAAGLAAGFGPWLVRRVLAMITKRMMARYAADMSEDAQKAAALAQSLGSSSGGTFFSHVFGGVASASIGAALWDALGYYGLFAEWGLVQPDLYLAAALGVFAWGLTYGLLTWGIPSELYAGWIRVLSVYRSGHRIPVDRPDGKPAERFVGHFPRGLDVYLPADRGVAELHTSFVVDDERRYAVRGLSVQRTVVKRFLEQVKLHYNVRRPAPLETELKMEDRVIMGDGANETVVEFILLPKEES